MNTSVVVRNWIRLFLWLLLAAMVSPGARAWTSDGKALWPDGLVKVNVLLGESPVYADGNTPNTAANERIIQWNKYMKRVQLGVTKLPAGTGAEGDNSNDVFFASSWNGVAIPSTVKAMTIVRTSGTARVEADIILNSSLIWDSYLGSVRSAPDIGRIVAHETGHLLGLGDSETRFSYEPIMRGTPSVCVNPQIDDVEGIATLYGAGAGFEPPLPRLSGWFAYSYDTNAYYTILDAASVELKTPASYSLDLLHSTYACQWFKDGIAITGATLSTFTIGSAQLADAGVYYVEVTGYSGMVRSKKFTVTVTPRRVPTVSLITSPASSLTVSEKLLFSAKATGSTPLSYQWQKDGVDIVGATSATYSVASVALTDAGTYRVVATNDVGSATSGEVPVAVKAIVAPTFIVSPPKVVYLVEGEKVSVALSATPPVSTQWQWYKEGVLQSTSSSTYNFLGQESEAGNYTVKITNAAGALSFDFTVTISPKPEISSLQISSSVSPNKVVGESYGYYSRYTSGYSYQNTYQWYKDGEPLVGQTDSSLSIPSLKLSDEGDYYVVAKNAQGRVTSNISRLTVSPFADNAAVGWVRPVVYSGVAYVLQADPAVVLRYDLVNGKALSALSLPSAAAQLCVGSAGVFVGTTAGQVYRCPLDSSTFTLAQTFSGAVLALATSGDSLYCLIGNQLYSINLPTNVLSSPQNYNHFSKTCGILISEAAKSLIVWDTAINVDAHYGPVSWANVSKFSIGETGLSFNLSTSAVGGATLYMMASGKSLISSAGDIWDLDTLKRTGSLGMGVGGYMGSQGDRFLVLHGAKVYLLDSSLNPVQSMSLPSGTVGATSSAGVFYSIQMSGQNVPIYTPLNLGEMKDYIPTSPAFDASSAPGLSDLSFVDKNDVLWRINWSQRTLVGWSPETKTIVTAKRLRAGGLNAVYSADLHRIYFYYLDGALTVMDLSQAEMSERLFINAGLGVSDLKVAGSFLVMDKDYNPVFVYDAQARLVTQRYVYPWEPNSLWDTNQQSFYGIATVLSTKQDKVSVVYTHAMTSEGVFAGEPTPTETPGLSVIPPLRLGGGNLLLGSGQLCDLKGTTLKASLPRPHVDAQYVNGAWFTLYSTMDGCLVNKWDGALSTVVKSANLLGQPVALFPISGNRLLVLGDRYGAPRYTILDENLTVLSTTGPSKPSRLANLSVQADAGQGQDALVPGFVINGTTPKTLLLRGSGPGLAGFGVPNCLVDPTITLYNKSGVTLDSNDNWGSLSGQRALRERSADLYAFTLAQGSKDAVLLKELNPGAYSAQVQGVNKGEGRALVEIYDADEAPGDSRAVNLSARCKISKGHEAVGGFVIQGDKPMTVLIRAVGPGLIKYSVTGTSADPKLRVFSGSQVIAENNDWSADPNQAATLLAAFASTGAFALDTSSKDAALLVTLQPGNYTVYMESADGGSGVSILEFYEVD